MLIADCCNNTVRYFLAYLRYDLKAEVFRTTRLLINWLFNYLVSGYFQILVVDCKQLDPQDFDRGIVDCKQIVPRDSSMVADCKQIVPQDPDTVVVDNCKQ